jgi:hypothetical protein
MKRLALVMASLPILTLAVVGAVRSRVQNHVVIVNDSGQSIRIMTVQVGGATIRFEDLSAGASASAPFVIRGDDSFQVRGRLEDGTSVTGGHGYVTNGMYGEDARFVIRPGGELEFKQRRGRF